MIIPVDMLDDATLKNVIEEFATRDGTDFTDLAAKVERVESQLLDGSAKLVYDPDNENCTIITAQDAALFLESSDFAP